MLVASFSINFTSIPFQVLKMFRQAACKCSACQNFTIRQASKHPFVYAMIGQLHLSASTNSLLRWPFQNNPKIKICLKRQILTYWGLFWRRKSQITQMLLAIFHFIPPWLEIAKLSMKYFILRKVYIKIVKPLFVCLYGK